MVNDLGLAGEELLMGEMVPVFITEAMEYDLIGVRAWCNFRKVGLTEGKSGARIR
jgi:hypothetical protein